MVDTNVFISFEKKGAAIDLSSWNAQQETYISVVTVAELLMGVYRADSKIRRERRSTFVEAIIGNINVLNIDVAIARVHAELYVDLAAKGLLIGAHDLMIAATAVQGGHALLTNNVSEFSRIPRLHLVAFSD